MQVAKRCLLRFTIAHERITGGKRQLHDRVKELQKAVKRKTQCRRNLSQQRQVNNNNDCHRPHLCLVKALAGNADNLLKNVADVFSPAMADRWKAVGYVVAIRDRRCQYVAHTVVINCDMATIHR